MPRPVPTLQGTLVILRAIAPQADSQDYYEWNLDPRMHEWTGNQVLADPAEARAELERFAQLEQATMWAIADKTTGRMIGRFFVCLEDRDGLLVAGEGNRMARPFWRKGHNRDARRLVFRYVFETLGADVIETHCWKDNVNSRESNLAHGFELAQETVKHHEKQGRVLLVLHFRLTRDQWRDRRF